MRPGSSAIAIVMGVLLGVPEDALGDAALDRVPVSDSTVTVWSADRAHALDGRCLSFPGPVSRAYYDSAGHSLIVRFSLGTVRNRGPMKGPREDRSAVAAYDLAAGRVMWAIESDGWPVSMACERLLLATHDESFLHDRRTGARIRDLPRNTRLYGDCALLSINPGRIAGYASESGDLRWEARPHLGEEPPLAVRAGDTLLVVSEGVMSVDVMTGQSWEYPVPTMASRTASTTLTNILKMGIGILGGSLAIPTDWGDQTTNLGSAVFDRDRIYLAADTLVLALHRRTGRFLWKHTLAPDEWRARQARAFGVRAGPIDGGHMRVSKIGDSLIVLNCGWSSSRKGVWRADPPALTVIHAETGTLLTRVPLKVEYLAREYVHGPRGHYVLTGQELLRLDHEFREAGRYVHSDPAIALMSVSALTDTVLVETANSLLALSADSLRVLWRQPLGPAIAWSAQVDSLPTLWAAGRRAMVRLDARLGEPVRFTLPQADPSFQDGSAVAIQGRAVFILPLHMRSAGPAWR